ncbi:MAG TPA: cytidine deaminase [Acidimicrobiales bacterium]|nr:cytidine deaminase [Acidimicrobiales bacterium]
MPERGCKGDRLHGDRLHGDRQHGGIDWDELRSAADAAAHLAYAPYSGLRVGAAALCEDGRRVTGCNVENASFGLTLCAECSLVATLVSGGRSRLVALSVTAGDGRPVAPCGRCRQVLLEHGGPNLLLDGGPGEEPMALGDLLPRAFDGAELRARRSGPASQGPGQ